jgi:TIR domain-containing protein
MPKIAISYRRADSAAIAGRIFDRLVARYGAASVFMDIDNIPIGRDFRHHIQETLQHTDILIAVIGPRWLGADEAGAVRMQETSDPVRVEIETALERSLPIIPVLVDGARMPQSNDLPPEFGNFAFLNAAEVATGRDFHTHIERLIAVIDRAAAAGTAATPPYSPSHKTQSDVKDTKPMASATWLTDTLRYFAVPLVLLLVAHHVIVNAFDLNTNYLWAAATIVPCAFGFALYWVGRRNTGPAIAFALALGVAGVAGMTVSQSLNSGDPIMPQTRFEWWDNINFAAIIALSFVAGHVLARALRAARSRKPARP